MISTFVFGDFQSATTLCDNVISLAPRQHLPSSARIALSAATFSRPGERIVAAGTISDSLTDRRCVEFLRRHNIETDGLTTIDEPFAKPVSETDASNLANACTRRLSEDWFYDGGSIVLQTDLPLRLSVEVVRRFEHALADVFWDLTRLSRDIDRFDLEQIMQRSTYAVVNESDLPWLIPAIEHPALWMDNLEGGLRTISSRFRVSLIVRSARGETYMVSKDGSTQTFCPADSDARRNKWSVEAFLGAAAVLAYASYIDGSADWFQVAWQRQTEV